MRDKRGIYDCRQEPLKMYDIWELSEVHTDEVGGYVDRIEDNVDAITHTLAKDDEVAHLIVVVITEFYRSINEGSNDAEENAIGILGALFFIKYMKNFDELSASCEDNVLRDRYNSHARGTLLDESRIVAEECAEAFLVQGYRQHMFVYDKKNKQRSMSETTPFKEILKTLNNSTCPFLDEFCAEIIQLP